MHEDGTIYINGAGGVLNRLIPDGQGGYDHCYAIIDGESSRPVFIQNAHQATLLAVGDKPVAKPLIKRTIKGVEIDRPFFQSYEEQSPDFNMLLEQDLVTKAKHKELWSKEKRALNGAEVTPDNPACSVRRALDNIRNGIEVEKHTNGLCRKDGPFKDEIIRVWERNNEQFPNKAKASEPDKRQANEQPVYAAADRLMPNLSTEWQGRLYTQEDKWKVYDERLPVYRGCISEIPGDSNQLVVAVAGKLYRMNHKTGEMSRVLIDGGRLVDTRGLIALDDKTFIMGDMGLDLDLELKKGEKLHQSLKVVVDRGDGTAVVSEKLTRSLLNGMKGVWNCGEKDGQVIAPRVKALVAGRKRSVAAINDPVTLCIRTKRAGNDMVAVDVQLQDGRLKVSNSRTLKLSDTLNSEFFSVVGDTLISGRETEDYTRTGYLPSVRHHLGAFRTESTVDIQQPVDVLPELPQWVFYSGYGYDGLYVG